MFSELEEQRIVRAIANAERDNRGEVQVRVERRCMGDPLVRAQALYKLAGLEGTADDTGVLLYVASESHVSAVYCGAGVHARSEASFWQGVSDRVAAGYRSEKPVDGICEALAHVGDLLRTLLPGGDEAGNERPNTLHTEGTAKRDAALDELTPDVFPCVGCGAQVSFREEEEGRQLGDASLTRATCPYCGTVNERALALLRKQHAAERHAARLREEQQKRARMLAFVAALALLVLLGIAGASTHTKLRELHTQVERARSQVENVRERQVAVVTRLAGADPSLGRDAELSGAENRVRIERMRYDEAAATYNAAAGSGWAGLWAKLTALPARAPLSNEAQW